MTEAVVVYWQGNRGIHCNNCIWISVRRHEWLIGNRSRGDIEEEVAIDLLKSTRASNENKNALEGGPCECSEGAGDLDVSENTEFSVK